MTENAPTRQDLVDLISAEVWRWFNEKNSPWSPSDATVSDFTGPVADALLVRYRMIPHTVLSEYYAVRQEAHDRCCGCELIGCEFVVGWNEALAYEYTRDKTIDVDGLLWASEGMAHRAALTQAGTSAVLSVERIRGGEMAQTAVLNPQDRLQLALALLSDVPHVDQPNLDLVRTLLTGLANPDD